MVSCHDTPWMESAQADVPASVCDESPGVGCAPPCPAFPVWSVCPACRLWPDTGTPPSGADTARHSRRPPWRMSGCIWPRRARSNVDLPAPLGPSTARCAPSCTTRSTPSRAVRPPRVTRSRWATTRGTVSCFMAFRRDARIVRPVASRHYGCTRNPLRSRPVCRNPSRWCSHSGRQTRRSRADRCRQPCA